MKGWYPTAALIRALVLGGCGLALAVALGKPSVLVLVAPLLVLAVPAVLARPTSRPDVDVVFDHGSLVEGHATRVRLLPTHDSDVEQVTRATPPGEHLEARPAHGCLVSWHGAGAEVPLEVSARRWGRRTLGEERVALTSAWAGYRWGPVQVPGRQVLVLPSAPPLESRAEQPQPRGLVGAHRSDRPGSGTELAGIRGFQPGDRLRRIHWAVSARTGELHVTTTRAEQDAGLLLVVDLLAEHGQSDGVDGRESSLDITVRAAAAFAELAVHRGDRVGVRPVGGRARAVPSGAGQRHLRRVLGALADVVAGDSPYDDLTRVYLRVGAGTTVVILSPLLADAIATTAATLVRSGVPVVVIDTLPADFVADLGERDPAVSALAWRMRRLEREGITTALDAIGCPVVPWHGRGTIDDVFRSLRRRGGHSRMRA
ncbi:DUF58 domain-containing protein [soil metagenome]